MPSRLIGHRLKVRVYDDRVEALPRRELRVRSPARSCCGRGPCAPDRLPASGAGAQAQARGAGALAVSRCTVAEKRVRGDLAAPDRAAARAARGAGDGRVARARRRPRLRGGAGARGWPRSLAARRAARSGSARRGVRPAPGEDAGGVGGVAGARRLRRACGGPHERRHDARCRRRAPVDHAHRAAAAHHQAAVGGDRRAVRPRGLAGRAVALGAVRARDRRAREPAARPSPSRIQPRRRQDARQLRLRAGAHRLQGPRRGARPRATSGSRRAPTCCCSVRPDRASRTW